MGIVLIVKIPSQQVMPYFCGDQIDPNESNTLRFARNVMESKDRLASVQALTPEGEDLLTKMKSVLSCVWMECCLFSAYFDSSSQFVKYRFVMTVRVI